MSSEFELKIVAFVSIKKRIHYLTRQMEEMKERYCAVRNVVWYRGADEPVNVEEGLSQLAGGDFGSRQGAPF